MKFEDLDDEQHQVAKAVLDGDSPTLVLGGPGTGKTTTALWAARAYLDQEGPSARTLFLTFSRSAVAQVTARSPGVLSAHDERVEILTFHKLAYRLLRAFGRYAGYGISMPAVQSDARTRLLGNDPHRLRYDDLITAARSLLESGRSIRDLVRGRWGLVVCDEVQDTSADQWQLLQLLAPERLLLLGDENQMIYGFRPGVSPRQFDSIRESARREIELLPRSYRDPSGAIPALAEAIRSRDFMSEAVVAAVRSGRLVLHFDIGDDVRDQLLVSEVRNARTLGSRDVGVFAHSNAAVAQLGEVLNAAGIEHALVGIPEAHAEALGAMAAQCAYAAHLADERQVRESFALFLTASQRGRDAPYMARALVGGTQLPELVDSAMKQLEQRLMEASTGMIGQLTEVVATSWESLQIQAAFRPWQRAAQHFRRLAADFRDEPAVPDSVNALLEVVDASRTEALIDLDYSEYGQVRLMNYHQTKGREADTVIHVFLPDDYFGRDREPFTESSRLLNVAISRARDRVVVLLPTDPHDLVKPFVGLRNLARVTP